VFFFPDRNLGTNTARRLGVSERDIVVWNESVEIDSLRSARVIVWPGACNTHQRFYTQHVERIRERYPGAHVVVHPECRPAVVAQADASGSTRELIRQVEISPPGATVAIGTEATLVSRLAGQYSNKRIINLSDVPAHCSSMREMSAQELRALLQAISQGRIDRCSLAVDAGNAQLARRALERMLRI
jgi:quinolinate synthase